MSRITNSMLTSRVLSHLQTNLSNMSRLEENLATGRRFNQTIQNPVAYVSSMRMRSSIYMQRRYMQNIDYARSNLEITESSLDTVTTNMQRARTLLIQARDEALNPEGMRALGLEINQIIDHMLDVANTNQNGVYIFGGDKTLTVPFERQITAGILDEVIYHGDFETRDIEVYQGHTVPANLHGGQAFLYQLGRRVAAVAVDPQALLGPQLVPGTANPPTPNDGTFLVNGVALTYDSATDTLESLRDKINATVRTAKATITSDGKLSIQSLTSENIQLASGTSNVLESLNMFLRVDGAQGAVGSVTGATTLAANGVIPDALSFVIDGTAYDLNLADLGPGATYNDLLARINNAGFPLQAYINADESGLEISITQSAQTFEIAETRSIFGNDLGGAGIINPNSQLADPPLNILMPPGTIRISVGTDDYLVDLSQAETVGDVIRIVNEQVPAVEMRINDDGSGVIVQSLQPGFPRLEIADDAGNPVAANLGIAQVRDNLSAEDLFGAHRTGRVDGQETKSLFKTLTRIASQLETGHPDQDALGKLLGMLDDDIDNLLEARSLAGSRVNRVDATYERYTSMQVYLTRLLSENEDADLTYTITQLNTQSNILNASLAAASRIITPSLLDYLR